MCAQKLCIQTGNGSRQSKGFDGCSDSLPVRIRARGDETGVQILSGQKYHYSQCVCTGDNNTVPQSGAFCSNNVHEEGLHPQRGRARRTSIGITLLVVGDWEQLGRPTRQKPPRYRYRKSVYGRLPPHEAWRETTWHKWR